MGWAWLLCSGNRSFCGGGRLELQRNVTWVPIVDAEVLRCCNWREDGKADQRMTVVVLEGG